MMATSKRMFHSELSDEVTKINKKEQLLLQRRLRSLEKEERMANYAIDQTVKEAEKLQMTVLDCSRLRPDLRDYDARKSLARTCRYGSPVIKSRFDRRIMSTRRNDDIFKLPPVSGANMNSRIKMTHKDTKPSHRPTNQIHCDVLPAVNLTCTATVSLGNITQLEDWHIETRSNIDHRSRIKRRFS